MKKRTLFLLLIAATFVFAGCLGDPKAEVKDNKTDQEAPVTPAVNDDGLDTRIYGTWNRTATYTDGVNMETDAATTMFMEDGTYTSIGSMCTVNGAYIVLDDLLNWTINSNNCPGFSGPYDYFSTFKISEDGDGLTIDTTMDGHVVTETFVRATY